jgi:hypothetical protein
MHTIPDSIVIDVPYSATAGLAEARRSAPLDVQLLGTSGSHTPCERRRRRYRRKDSLANCVTRRAYSELHAGTLASKRAGERINGG